MKNKKKPEPELPQRLNNELAASGVGEKEFYTNIFHAVNPGDLVASMAAIKKFFDVTKRKTCVLQKVGQQAAYYSGATHPTLNSEGVAVCMNDTMFDMLKPLVESQYYIGKMEKYEGQRIDLDFNVIRGKTFVNMPNNMIQSWVMFAFPDLAIDLSKPWIELSGKCPPNILKQVKGKVIINFTERYRNTQTDYFFLKPYASDLIFAGTEKEHWLFCNQWQLSTPRLEIKDFLEYAYAIKYCRFLLGCQTLGWNLAEAMKSPRILEMCSFAPNCMPFIGEDSYGFFHQVGVEYYFKIMYNKTNNK
jgi:hypothetical protein